MWLLDYRGAWNDCSARHPEQLVELAPRHLGEQCVRTGGLNLYERPRFRLARIDSRFMISGGVEINFYDPNGNLQKTIPDTILMPRYPEVPRRILPCYVLERWRAAEWYARHGFGRNLFVLHGFTNIQQGEPIWPQGGYEAVIRGFNDPWIFPMNVSTWTIYKAIRWTLISDCYSTFGKDLLVNEQRRKQEEASDALLQEKIKNWIGPFGFASHDAGLRKF